jgi:hypothetical protein
LILLRRDRDLDTLRADPRFQAIESALEARLK